MANSDKNILITPNRGAAADPKIDFVGANASVGPQTITMSVYPDSNGTLSWDGSAGQLFSITNDLTGTIFSVNDVSGIPSLEINANGTVKIAEFSGNVGIGLSSPTEKLDVSGNVKATTFIGNLSGNAATATTLQTARTINGVSFNGSANITVADATKLPLAGGSLTGSLTLTGNATSIRQNTTATWSGDAPNGVGKLEYHSNRWYINAGANSTEVVQFRRGASAVATINNSGVYSGSIAGSAATLTTARAINGTNFNGSAAITTANWGTARTIWGQSINGSANITAPVRPAVGSVTAPAFSTSGDTNTGIYFVAADQLGVTTGGAQRGLFNSTGLSVTGDINSTSDIRLKRDVKQINNALEKVLQLRGVSYTLKESGVYRIGVIAQEVEEVIPEVVGIMDDADNTKTVSYGNLVGLLIEAIKELSTQIDELTKDKHH